MSYTDVKLDKLVLSNIKINSFGSEQNYRALIDGQLIKVNKGAKMYCRPKDNNVQIFSNLNIAKDLYSPFDKFWVCMTRNGEYSEISLSINDSETGNLYCYSVQEYKSRIRDVESYLSENYHITVDCSNVVIKNIEINKTISLEQEFHKYRRIFTLIQYDLPKIYVSHTEYEDIKHKETGVSAGTFRKANSKECEILKIYDKTKQLLREGFNISKEKNYLRVELTLKGKRVVEKHLKTNKLNKLKQEDVDYFFYSRINELVDNIENHRLKISKKLSKKIQSQKGKTGWIKGFLSELIHTEQIDKYPIVLDVRQLFPIVDSVFGKLRRQRKYELKKRLQDYVCKDSNLYGVLGQQDDEKLKEIIQKIQG